MSLTETSELTPPSPSSLLCPWTESSWSREVLLPYRCPSLASHCVLGSCQQLYLLDWEIFPSPNPEELAATSRPVQERNVRHIVKYKSCFPELSGSISARGAWQCKGFKPQTTKLAKFPLLMNHPQAEMQVQGTGKALCARETQAHSVSVCTQTFFSIHFQRGSFLLHEA